MNFDDIVLDPASAFDEPQQVLQSKSLSREQKVQVLHRWEYDARQLLVAEGEGMGDINAEQTLKEIQTALETLDAEPGVE